MNLALRPVVPNDFQFAFDAKRDAIGPHVVARWGWDEQFQLEHHRKQWVSKTWQVITLDSSPIGTVSIDLKPSHMQFGEFYILKAYRSQGIGTKVLAEALKVADQKCLETRLEYLKWNPVASLYARHGFQIVGENEIHFFLVRLPNEA